MMTVVPDNATLCDCGSPIMIVSNEAIKRIKKDCLKCKGRGWYTAKGPGQVLSEYFPPGVDVVNR